MYFLIIVLLLAIAPLGSIYYEASYLHSSAPLLLLVGTWFTFWAAGVRLFIAGMRQVIQPRFTAREIFEIDDDEALPLVREIGFGNLSMGILSLATWFKPAWLLPAALVGGLYYGLAGLMHVSATTRNAKETVAMLTDLAMAVVLLGFFGLSLSAS
jgi:hypothetical protein